MSIIYRILILLVVFMLSVFSTLPLFAEGKDGVCAEVKLEILQELTLERIGFDARLGIKNDFDNPLEEISVEIEIRDAEGNHAEESFFWRIESLTDIDAIDGTGTIASETKGVIHWLIIPKTGTGGETPAGQRYAVSANIAYSVNGKAATIRTWDDWITVYPQPELVVDYYLPKKVPGDDPFTENIIEPSDPFFLAVRVTNVGKGPATGSPIAEDPTISVQTEVVEGWLYAEVPEPTDGTIPIVQMIRSDGKVLNPRNYWLNDLKIHFVDLNTTGQYTVVYSPSVFDSMPPVTSLNIRDPKVEGEPTVVNYYTIFYLSATDEASGVAKTEYQIDDESWKLSSPTTPSYGPGTRLTRRARPTFCRRCGMCSPASQNGGSSSESTRTRSGS